MKIRKSLSVILPLNFLRKGSRSFLTAAIFSCRRFIISWDWIRSAGIFPTAICLNMTWMISCQSWSIPGSSFHLPNFLPANRRRNWSSSPPLNFMIFTVRFLSLRKKTTLSRHNCIKTARKSLNGGKTSSIMTARITSSNWKKPVSYTHLTLPTICSV